MVQASLRYADLQGVIRLAKKELVRLGKMLYVPDEVNRGFVDYLKNLFYKYEVLTGVRPDLREALDIFNSNEPEKRLKGFVARCEKESR